MNQYNIQERIAEAKQKIEKLLREDSLVMPLFTDLHTPSLEHPSVNVLCDLLSALTGQIPCDAVINLGDNPAMLGRDTHISNDDLMVYFKNLLEKIYRAAGCPVITAHGNHDAIGTDFFDSEYWNTIFKHRYGNTSAVFGEEGSYYYVDCDRAGTRLVVLSVPHGSDLEAEFPSPLWGFGKAQLEWLENTALATEKNVILIIHVPFWYEYRGDTTTMLGVWNGEREAVSYISALCGWIDDVEEASEIVNRFSDRTGRLLACFSGHTHSDSFRDPFEEQNDRRNPLACSHVVTRRFWNSKHEEDECGFALDVLVWTPSQKRMDLVRIGDGEDRRIL